MSRICPPFLWVVQYSGLSLQGARDFFWLGRVWMVLWRGITVVVERSSTAFPVGMLCLLQRKEDG